MKFNDVVIYSEGNKEFNALVLGERQIADHSGADGEPLLTLVFCKERLDASGIPLPLHGTGQTSELVQIRLDVAHESHEYSEAQQRNYGKVQYDGGRWREVSEGVADDSVPADTQAATQAPSPQLVPAAPPAPAPAPAETPITAESLGLTDAGEKKEE